MKIQKIETLLAKTLASTNKKPLIERELTVK